MECRAIKLKSPSRIDIMSKESFEIFSTQIELLEKQFDVVVEEPLPNAKLRGVYKVVFLDKHKLKGCNDVQWIKY
jgi:hypothetical protein